MSYIESQDLLYKEGLSTKNKESVDDVTASVGLQKKLFLIV